QPAAAAAARARGGRQRLSLRRPPVRVQGRPELENSGRLGQRGKAVEPGARRDFTRPSTAPRSRRASRTVVGTKRDAVAAGSRRRRLSASQQGLVSLPFARRGERLQKLHVAGGEQRDGEAVAVEQAVAR